MKRSYGNKAKSSKIVDYRYSLKFFDEEDFKGHMAMLEIDRVSQPVIRMLGNNFLKLADVGYTWLQTFQEDRNYSISAMFDQEDELVEWYIDIVENVGLTEEGIPFYDDLYLDIVALPNGEVYLLDEDELEEAYRLGDVNREEYELAKSQVDLILEEVLLDIEEFELWTRKYLKLMRA